MTTPKFVDFEKPPVVEVACGVSFSELPGFTVAHFGRFWDQLGSGFAEVEEVPPLAEVTETFDSPGVPASVPSLGVGTARVVTPRVWFVSDDKDHLVQLQKDRFLCNWRKLTETHEYPNYHWVIGKFEEKLQQFEEFTEHQFGIAPSYTQYELTYVNHIVAGEAWKDLADLGSVLPDCGWRSDASRFLPTPEGVDLRHSFVFPEKNGRLRVHVRNGERSTDKTPVLLMELTARGFGDERKAWFDIAHEWIVRGFADLTGATVQNSVWRRTQ